MRKSDFYYNSQSPNWTRCVTLVTLVIFCLTVTTFSVCEISNFYSDKEVVRDILLDDFKGLEAGETLKEKAEEEELLNPLNSERQARAAAENNTFSSLPKSNSYYEEQRPVVVYSKTDIESPIARRQMAEVPPKQDSEYDDPYNKAYDGGYEDSDDDYFGQPEPKQTQSPPYNSQLQEQASQPYWRQQPPSYYDDSTENFPGPAAEQLDSEGARAAQYHDGNNYYRSYPYATPSPAGMGNVKRLTAVNNAANRNMQMLTNNRAKQQQYRNPYPSYVDDYEYSPPNSQSLAPAQPFYSNRKYPPQKAQHRTPSTPPPAEEKQETSQMDFLTMFQSIKTMWDLYQSFTSSWNTIAEKRNREEELNRQKYKQQQQQQIRINSRQPPKFNSRRNSTITTRSPKKQLNGTTTTIAPTASDKYQTAENEEENKQPLAKVESRKAFKLLGKNEEAMRDKRQATDSAKDSNSVGEGRYIKGDPLKGYYDFVITEGSYKFWAAFQVGTAILIIYSTFAAIYYSKVNPLVSDYDYTDYLGGGRSLSGGDLDFVDDGDETTVGKKPKTKSWLEWLPRSGHSLKFILDAIDKLPTDHAKELDEQESLHYKADGEVKTASLAEDVGGGAEMDVANTTDEEYSEENGSYSSAKEVQEAM